MTFLEISACGQELIIVSQYFAKQIEDIFKYRIMETAWKELYNLVKIVITGVISGLITAKLVEKLKK